MIELTQEQRDAIKADSENGFGANVGDTQRLLAGYTRLEQECERLRHALRVSRQELYQVAINRDDEQGIDDAIKLIDKAMSAKP